MTATRHRPPIVPCDVWEAFGCPPQGDAPTVRFVRHQRECDCLDPDTQALHVEWQAPGVRMSAWGDDTSGVLLKVYGANEDATRAMYQRAAAVLPELLHHIWNTPPRGNQ